MMIAIVDDERPARCELKRQLMEICEEKKGLNVRFLEGDSGASALQLVEKYEVELLFLDINLGDINGTNLVTAIKKIRPGIQIVFVTAYSQYAVKAFELEVQDYIMKPFGKERVLKVLNKYLEGKKVSAKASSDKLMLSLDGKQLVLDTKKIVYIETYHRGCLLHTTEGDYFENRSLGEYDHLLSQEEFFRIHKSYIVCLDAIKEFFPWGNNCYGLHVHGYEKEILPVSREKMKRLKELFGI